MIKFANLNLNRLIEQEKRHWQQTNKIEKYNEITAIKTTTQQTKYKNICVGSLYIYIYKYAFNSLCFLSHLLKYLHINIIIISKNEFWLW